MRPFQNHREVRYGTANHFSPYRCRILGCGFQPIIIQSDRFDNQKLFDAVQLGPFLQCIQGVQIEAQPIDDYNLCQSPIRAANFWLVFHSRALLPNRSRIPFTR
jgi:hypothetical protein